MCASPARHRAPRRESGAERQFWTASDLLTTTGGHAKHARPLAPKYALPIGRVGALAVSLGIGLAVANSSGVAYADSDSESSVSASRDTDRSSSGPRRSGADRTAPSQSDSAGGAQTDGVGELAEEELEEPEPDDSDGGRPGGELPAEEADDPAAGGTQDATRGSQRRHTQRSAESATTATTTGNDETVETATPQLDESGVDDAAIDDVAIDDRAEPSDDSVILDLPAADPTETTAGTPTASRTPVASAARAKESVETVDMMTALVSNIVSPFADPSAPARAPWFDAVLAWVRRQITHTFFNKTPVWGPVESHQLLTGQVEFDLNASDPNGDPLSFDIVQPSHGVVTRNPLTGKFIYTPKKPVTGKPLKDTFHVTISDSSEHLTGIAGLIQGVFHSVAKVIGLAQKDTVTLAVSVTVNPIIEMAPIVVVTPVGAGTVGTAVRVSPVVIITDLDSEKLASATVRVTGGSGDVLGWGNLPQGISAAYTDGVLTFTGAATAEAYQQALQSVTLTSANAGLKTVSFSVVDDAGNASTVPATAAITIVGLPVEVPPLVIVTPIATGRTDNQITVSPIVVITDVDSDTLTSATVRISNPADGDALDWGTVPSGFGVTTGNGWVTFTGEASAETYQQLLQSITLTSAAPGLKSVSFSVVDDDGNVSTLPALTAVTVLGLPVEVPPLIVVTPVATGSAGSPIVVSPIVVITDLDSSQLGSATVRVKDAVDGDVLSFGELPTGVTATYADGVLTFTGTASVEQYQALLRSVTLTSPDAGLKSVSFTVTDAQGNVSSVPAATIVTVVGLPTEVPPLVVVTPVATGSAGSPIVVSPIVVITDLDSSQLRSATVRIKDAVEGDLLGYGGLPTGVTATYADGVLTFSGVASVSEYRALLQSVTFTSESAGLKAISFAVTDAQGNTSAVPAGTVVTVVGLSTEVAPLVVVAPVAAGVAGSAVRISPIVVITDLDSNELRSATVRLKDPEVGDVLGYGGLPTGVTATYADGVLTFSGTASVADYQALLSSVTLTSTDAGLKAITFSVTDVQGNTSVIPAGTVVTVVGVPAEVPPLVVVSPVAAGVAGSPVKVSPIVVITDLDSDRLRSATVTLKDADAEDVFGYGQLPTNVSATYADGVLTFTGEASVAEYRTLLASVTLTSPAAGLKAVSFAVTDVDGNTSTVPAGTVVTVVGMSADVPPLIVVSPVAAGSAGSPIKVSPIVVISDLDSDELRSATVRIADPSTGDSLDFDTSLLSGLSAAYAGGVLTFAGEASIATYRALLQSVTLTTADTTVKAVSFSITDAEGNVSTVPAGTVVTVVGVPDVVIAPVVVVSPVAAGVIGTAVKISPIVVITDLDSSQLRSATVSVKNPKTGDVLAYTGTLPTGITASYADGVLTFTGEASTQDYERLLASVTLTSEIAGLKAIDFAVTDGQGHTSAVPAGTLVTMVGLSTEVPPLVVVSPVAAGRTGAPIRVSPIVVITDVDSDRLGSATVTLANPSDGDVLGFDATLATGVSATYAGGVLRFEGVASVADYQRLLASVTLTTADAALKTVSFAVTDVEGNTSVLPAGTVVTVVGVPGGALPPVVVVSPVAAGTVGKPTTVSPIIVIRDLDSSELGSATVTLRGAAADDVLGFDEALLGGLQAGYAGGVLTFTGTASVEHYEALLASVTLTSPTAGLKSVSFEVTDLHGETSVVPAATVVTLVGLSSEVPPLVLVSPVAAGTADAPIKVSPIVVITDVDSRQLSSARVVLKDAAAADVLSHDALPTGIMASYADGVLTFTGTASVDQYEALLASVTLTSPTAGVKSLTFSVTDVDGNSSVVGAPTLVTVVGAPALAFDPLLVVTPVAAGTVGSAVRVSPVIVITDLDSDRLASAVIRVKDAAVGDVLAYTGSLPDGVSAEIVGAELTFTGLASEAAYRELLASVTLTSAEAGVKLVSFSIVDDEGNQNSLAATTTVTMLGVSTDLPPLVLVSPVAAGTTGSPIVVSPIIVLTDVDSDRLSSAVIRLQNAAAGDVLGYTAALPDGVSAEYADGQLTFTGPASVAAYQALLQSVTLTSTSVGAKAVSFTVTDVDGNTSAVPAGTVVTVVGLSTEIAPLVLVSPVAAGTVGSSIVVSPIVVITDVDSAQLASAGVRIRDAEDGDVLDTTATLPEGVSAEYVDGVLTFTGLASTATYQKLLQSVTITSTTADVKTVSFVVTDADGNTSVLPASTLVTVVGVPGVSVPPVVLVSPVAAGRTGSPISVSPILLITDVDSSRLRSATVTLTGAEIGDSFTYGSLPADVTATYADGVLTFSGVASVEDYQTLLRSVALTSSAVGVKTVSFSVTDIDDVTSVLPAATLVTVVGVPGTSIAPVVVASPVTAGTVDEPVRISPVLIISDVDSDRLRSAAVVLENAGAGDSFGYGSLPPNVTATYADGVLTFSGVASVEDYQTLLRSVTLTSTAAGMKAITFSVTDAEGVTNALPAGTLVTVVGLTTEAAPLVLVSPVAAGVAGSAIVVSPIVMITDPDSDRLLSATVRLADAVDGDVLALTGEVPTGVTASYAGGVLTISGDASVAEYEALLRSVTLTSADGGVKTVSFAVTDASGTNNVLSAATLVTVVGVPGGLALPPVVVVSPAAAGTVGSPTRVSPIVLISDGDSDHLNSATVTVRDAGSGDVLAVGVPLPSGVQASYVGGVLSITGTATLEQYQQLLQSVTLTSETAGVKAVSFSVTDTDGKTNTLAAGTLVTVIGLSSDVPPLVLVSPAAVGRANSGIVVSPIVSITDPDSGQLRSATVRINNPEPDDRLTVTGTLPTGVTATYAGGVLTITGAATVAQYEALLQRVTLTAASGGVKTISFAVTDVEGTTSVLPATTAVTVVGLLDLSIDPVVVVAPVAAGSVGDEITVSPVVVITDLDSSVMRSARVAIDNPDAGDVLGYRTDLPEGIQAEFADGVLTFTGLGTEDQYEALLQSVTLTSQSAGVKTISYSVTDLLNNESVAVRTAVTVLGVPATEIPPVLVVALVAAGAVGRTIRVSPLSLIRDVDSDRLSSITIRIENPDEGDVLGYDAALPQNVSVAQSGSVLTFSGPAAVADYETLLRSVTLTSTTAGVKNVTFSVTDIGGTTNVLPAGTAVTVVGVPATSFAPVVVASPVAAGSAGSAIRVSPILVIGDVDSSRLRSATVTLEGYADGDVLGFDASAAPGILASYTNGLLTFSGEASVEDYQALLRSVTLTSATHGIKTVTFMVTDIDGATNTVPAATAVTVVGVPGVALPPLIVVSPVAAGTVGRPIAVSPVVIITDVDSSRLRSATLTIEGYQDGDVLEFDAALASGISADYTDGILTFTGDASVEAYQALLRSVTLTSAADGLKSVTFDIVDSDGSASVLPAATLVTVVGLPSQSVAPIVLVSPVAAGLVGKPVAVSPIAVISDVNSTRIRSATVTVEGYEDGDVLDFDAALAPGVSGSYIDGVLTFTGEATTAEYQALLRSVTLTSATAGLRTVAFTVTDLEGASSSVSAATLVTVVGLPDAAYVPVVVVAPVAAGVAGKPIRISPVTIISDFGSTHLDAATVTVENHRDGDVLNFDAALAQGVSGSYADGVLTFTGTATVAEYQALLRSVTLTATGAGVKSVTVSVTDAHGATNSLPAATLVTVVGVPAVTHAPIVVVAPVAAGLVGDAITVSPVLLIGDADSTRIRSATVTLTGHTDGDVLGFDSSLASGVSGSYVDGVLTLTGAATLADYQALLQSVTLTSQTTGLKTVTFSVTDAEDNTNELAARTLVTVVGVPGVSIAPVVVVAPVAAGVAGKPVRVSPIVIITDPDSDEISSARITLADHTAGDVLSYTGALPAGVDVGYTDGVLTFSGAASAEDYQRMLAAVTVTSADAGVKVISFSVTDAQGNESALSAGTVVTVLDVPAVSLAPVVVVSPLAAGAAGRPIRVSPIVAIRDLDSDQLQSAIVTITDAQDGDLLDYVATLPAGVTVTNTGAVLTFTGPASVADYEALLRSVTLTSAVDGVKTVSFSVTDIDGKTSAVTAGTIVTVVDVPASLLAPVVVVSPVAAGTTGSSITVSPVLVIGDADSTQLRGARIVLNGAEDADVLGFTADLPENVVAHYAEGVLTFSGAATLGEYQTLLRSVTLTSTSAGLKVVSFSVTDAEGTASAVPAGTVVTVVGIDGTSIAPVVVVSPVAAGLVGKAIAVSPVAVIADVDSDRLRGARVVLGDAQDGDLLDFTAGLPEGVSATYAAGVLTFTGDATLSEYQALLRSVTLASAEAGVRTVSFSITDVEGRTSTLPAGTMVTVVGVPDLSFDPVIVVSPVAAGVAGSAIRVTPVVLITDMDSDRIRSAKVTIDNYSDGDVLSYSAPLPTGVVVDYTAGVLTVDGIASASDYQTILAAVTFTSPTAGIKTISFSITDEDFNESSVSAGTVVTVVGVPDALHAPVVVVAPLAAGRVGSAIRISPIVAIADVDSGRLSGATVRITDADADDVLAVDALLPAGVDVEFANGVLTFSGSATVAQYRELLASVTFTSQASGVKTVSFTVTDLEGHTSTVSAGTAVTVVGVPGVSIPPVVVVSPVAAGSVGSEITVSPIVVITDLDSGRLRSATVTVRDAAAGDVLSYSGTLPDGFDVSYTGGVLTISGDGTVAQYEAVLAAVTLTSTTDGFKTVSFAVTDSDGITSALAAATLVTVVGAPELTIAPVVVATPVAAGRAGSTITVSPVMVITDLDSGRIRSATVTIGNYDDGDVLAYTGTLPSGVTVGYANGVLTFDGEATVAQYEAMLAAVTLSSAAAGLKSVSFTVTDVDGNENKVPAATMVTVVDAPIKVSPLVVVAPAALGTMGNPIRVSPIVAITDLDSSDLDGATVTIGGYVDGDLLTYSGPLPGNVVADFAGGVLTFTGTASVEDYRALLESVMFTAAEPSLKTISFTVTDTDGNISKVPAGTIVTTSPSTVAVPPLVVVMPTALGTEGTPIRVSRLVVIADLDSSQIGSATVTIDDWKSGDVLGFTGALLPDTVSGEFVDGTLTFTGIASAAEYQALLASVTLTSPTAGLKSVSFTVADAENNTSQVPAGTVVTVVGEQTQLAPLVLVAPLMSGTVGNPIKVSPIVTIADLDSDLLGAVRVVIENFRVGDSLSYDSSKIPTGVLLATGSEGVLEFQGDASIDEYRELLQSVALTSTTVGLKSVSFTVTDVEGNVSTVPAGTVVTVVGLPSSANPVVLTSVVGVNYTAGSGGRPVDPNLILLDADSEILTGATVTIGNRADGDALSFGTLPEGIQGSYSNGVLTFTGTASVSDYQALLRSVTFSTTSSALASIKSISFTVTDDEGGVSLPGGVAVTVLALPVQAKPVVVTSLANVNYQAGSSAARVDRNLLIFDVDSENIKGAVVRIVGGASAGESLGFSEPAGIVDFNAAYDSATGTLTFTGIGSKAAYQELLRSVTFSSTSDALATIKSISFTITDAQDNESLPGLVAVTILKAATSLPPLVVTSLVNVEYTIGNTPIVVDGGLRLLDVDSETLRGATVKIGLGFASGDALTFDHLLASQFEVSGSYDENTGTLTFTGPASIDMYQQLLRTVKISTTPAALPTPKAVEFQVTDGAGSTSLPGLVAVTVLTKPTGLPPLVLAIAGPTYTAGNVPGKVTSGVTITDLEFDRIKSATIQITGNYVAGQDVLSFTANYGVTGSFNAATGTLTLTAADPISAGQFASVLNSVTIATPADATSAVKTLTFTVTDERFATSSSVDVYVTVKANTAPTVIADFVADLVGLLDGEPKIAGLATISDDSTYLRGAVVKLTDAISGDELTYLLNSNSGAISVVVSSDRKTLTFSGSGTVAQYEWVLRNISLKKATTPILGAPVYGFRTVTIQVEDQYGLMSDIRTIRSAFTVIL
ncbi:beta strand repeat-containing protein [Mycobacterium sp. SMC-4]|uniref:beta strand repeat-containing protein n=1 Tax=Mycobacterium sp. SMC-4 TaxID=2857059 RepID=UPI003D067437